MFSIRVFVALCLILTSAFSGLRHDGGGYRLAERNIAAPEVLAEALSPASVFMRQVFSVTGYVVRQAVAQYEMAWAGTTPGRAQIWEFEPPGSGDLLLADSAPSAGAPKNGKQGGRDARRLLDRIRAGRMRKGSLPIGKRAVEGLIFAVLVREGVPTSLAQRVARQLLLKCELKEAGGDETWRAIGMLLRRDLDWLLIRTGLQETQLNELLPKLSATHRVSFG